MKKVQHDEVRNDDGIGSLDVVDDDEVEVMERSKSDEDREARSEVQRRIYECGKVELDVLVDLNEMDEDDLFLS